MQVEVPEIMQDVRTDRGVEAATLESEVSPRPR